MLNVLKFGGSSVANATTISQIKTIVANDNSQKVIVVSAPGKDKINESKVTDLLFLLHAHIEYGIDYSNLLDTIYQRYQSIVEELELSNQFEQEFEQLKTQLTKGMTKDDLVSRGEYLCAKIVAEYLDYEFVDATTLIALKYDGSIDFNQTAKQAKKYNSANIVVPGYYGHTPNNRIRLFRRGGSDLTGSILARAFQATRYENWTDVNGIYVADPTIIDNPKRITQLSYNELRELAYRGANVLQQESVVPVEEVGIPIHIRNTNFPNNNGTIISDDITDNTSIITGISGLVGYTALNITKKSNHNVTVVLRNVLDLFLRYRLSVEHIPTGIDTFSVITKSNAMKDTYFDFMNDLRQIDGVTNIEEEQDISLIAIVGRNMAHIPGVAGRIFNTLGTHAINIKVIAQASKEISIIIGVNNRDYRQAIRVLYNEFYRDKPSL